MQIAAHFCHDAMHVLCAAALHALHRYLLELDADRSLHDAAWGSSGAPNAGRSSGSTSAGSGDLHQAKHRYSGSGSAGTGDNSYTMQYDSDSTSAGSGDQQQAKHRDSGSDSAGSGDYSYTKH